MTISDIDIETATPIEVLMAITKCGSLAISGGYTGAIRGSTDTQYQGRGVFYSA